MKSRELSRIVRLDGNAPTGCSAANSFQIAWMWAFDRSRYGFRRDSGRSSAAADARADIAYASPAPGQPAGGALPITGPSRTASVGSEPVRNIAPFTSSMHARGSRPRAAPDTL